MRRLGVVVGEVAGNDGEFPHYYPHNAIVVVRNFIAMNHITLHILTLIH